jgi:two-component system, NarL family, sensor histidine kinase YdfH
MFKRLIELTGMQRPEDAKVAVPFYVLVTAVIVGMTVAILRTDASMQGLGQRLLFVALMAVHCILHWFGAGFAGAAERTRRSGILYGYFVIQGLLLFAISFLTSQQEYLIGLYAALAGETAAIFWSKLRSTILVGLFYIVLIGLNFALVWDFGQFVRLLPTIGLIMAFCLIYVVLYIRQVQARDEAQNLLAQLEEAHRQLQAYSERVEELSVGAERERMARELHDTLAQGLAGLIMQLEAADGHLDGGNSERAQAVVQQATERAKMTLREARRVIQALRSTALEERALADAIGREVESFSATTDIRAIFELHGLPPEVSADVAQEILRIVQAALSNVVRHAQAESVVVRVSRPDGAGGRGERLQVLVQDDGVGFRVPEGPARAGCFGLMGMRERAESIGGVLRVESESGVGTRVLLEFQEDRT